MKLLAVGLVLLSLSTPPSPPATELPVHASSTSPAGCGYCSDFSMQGSYEHEFLFSGAIFDCAPNTCHLFVRFPGICGDYHNRCAADLFLAGKGPNSGLNRLRGAVQRGDTQAIHEILTQVATGATLNTDSRSIDIRDCGGALRARFSVPASVFKTLNLERRA